MVIVTASRYQMWDPHRDAPWKDIGHFSAWRGTKGGWLGKVNTQRNSCFYIFVKAVCQFSDLQWTRWMIEDNKRHLCAFNIFLDRGSSGCEFGQNASAFPSAIIGFRSHLPAWHPWSSLVRARASHWWLLVQILSNLLFQSRQSFSACTAVGILRPVLCALVFTIAWSTRMVPGVAMGVLTGTEWR